MSKDSKKKYDGTRPNIGEDLAKALNKYAKSKNKNYSRVAQQIIADYLTKKGYWEP